MEAELRYDRTSEYFYYSFFLLTGCHMFYSVYNKILKKYVDYVTVIVYIYIYIYFTI